MNDNQSTILTRIKNLQESEWKVLGTGYVDKFRLAKDLYDERMRLYDSMDTTYRNLSVDILNKEEELKKKRKASVFAFSESEAAGKRVNELNEKNKNVSRQIELTTYYNDRNNKTGEIIKKITIIISILVIIMVLYKQDEIYIPPAVIYTLTFVTITIGIVIFIMDMISVTSRDNMDFKKFDWNFNPPNEKENTIDLALDADIDTSALNLFGIKTPGIDCSEGECCGDGTVWDNALYKCKPAQV